MINENSEEHQKRIDDMRREMGTLPDLNTENKDTKIYVGVEGISAELIDWPVNPYRTIFEMAVATWGSEEYPERWSRTTPENRFKVVKAALSGQTIPSVTEIALFSFIVRGGSRSAFDQHRTQRFATFFSQGTRDNSRLNAGLRVPAELHPDNGVDADLYNDILDYVHKYKELYQRILKQGAGSFQSARFLSPMGMTHHYKYTVSLNALKGYLAQRLMACEQPDTVQVAIAIWNQVHKKFPLIASHLKPACDNARHCVYHKAGKLSELFSSLFAGCGRHRDPAPYSTFNRSCSSYEQMEKESGEGIPRPKFWIEYNSFEDLREDDKKYFRYRRTIA